jgi:hypothetical protein
MYLSIPLLFNELTPWLLLYIYFLTASATATTSPGMCYCLCAFFILLLSRCLFYLLTGHVPTVAAGIEPPLPAPFPGFDVWVNEPATSCTVISFPITKAPGSVRRKFAKQLTKLGSQTNRQYGGYARRESQSTVIIHIVTTDTESRDDLQTLWMFLAQRWPIVNRHDITYERQDFPNVHFLTDRFMVVQPSGEPDNWSNQAEDFDDAASQFSIVSSIPPSLPSSPHLLPPGL